MSKAVYAGVDGIARKVKKMYVGAPSLENYSEKNLLPQFAQAVTNSGITITPLKDGGLHITGSITSGSSMIVIQNPFDGSALAGSMYTFSVRTDTPETSGELQVRFLNASGGVVGASNMAVDTQLRYANVSSGYITTVTEFAVRLGSGITYDIVIYVQLEEGSEATEFDPYGVWKDIARKVKKAYIGVPSAYWELGYIECSGDQYIDSGFAPNQDTRVVIDIDVASASTAYDGIFGTRTKLNDTDYTLFIIPGAAHSGYGNAYIKSNVTTTGRYIIDKNKNVATVNGVVITNTSATFQCVHNMTIGKVVTYSGDNTYPGMNGKIYSCKVYDNNVLIRDYVPCVNDSGDVGLWDKVGRRFYANAGSGTFAAGEKTGTILWQSSVARQFYSAEFLTYDGAYSVSQVEYEGKTCNLYTLTGSGILTLNDDALVWMCGGGSGGRSAYRPVGNVNSRSGGGGAGAYAASGNITSGVFTVAIASGGGANGNGATTQVLSNGAVILAANGGQIDAEIQNGGNGGTGGASGAYWDQDFKIGTKGKGDGVSKYPFGITGMNAHCAGGGSGAYDNEYYADRANGGKGGTNGGNGSNAAQVSALPDYFYGGAGGAYGGGTGATVKWGTIPTLSSNATSGSFYGAGGGGGAYGDPSSGNTQYEFTSAGAAGYQGVVYILDVNGGVPA